MSFALEFNTRVLPVVVLNDAELAREGSQIALDAEVA